MTGNSSNLPTGETADEQAVADFLTKVRATPAPPRQAGRRGRLIFALDATASREPTWDQACHLQGEMFNVTADLGGLDVQLVFYRGYRECKASAWVSDTRVLRDRMLTVRCQGGRTQVSRVLSHALKETGKERVGAVVFVGDSFEEDLDEVAHKAGELGVLGTPVFVFHEGGDAVAASAFRQIARLSGGAYCPFNGASAQQLRDLLAAVAVYAAGGLKALQDFGNHRGGEVLALTHRLGGRG